MYRSTGLTGYLQIANALISMCKCSMLYNKIWWPCKWNCRSNERPCLQMIMLMQHSILQVASYLVVGWIKCRTSSIITSMRNSTPFLMHTSVTTFTFRQPQEEKNENRLFHRSPLRLLKNFWFRYHSRDQRSTRLLISFLRTLGQDSSGSSPSRTVGSGRAWSRLLPLTCR